MFYQGDLKKWGYALIPVFVLGAFCLWGLFNWAPDSFQRFGSAMIAVALLLFGIPSALQRVPGKVIRSEYEATICNLFVATVGTLIWGYGDLFHCWVNE